MTNEEIKAKQEQYRGLLTELGQIEEKIKGLGDVLTEVQKEFAAGNTISSNLFEQLIVQAQEYYTIDSSLKDSLEDVNDGAGFSIEGEVTTLKKAIVDLDQDLIRNSVSTYFRLASTDVADELGITKEDLHKLLDVEGDIDIAAIRPYSTILQLVENPDADIQDELMDELDDTFPKTFVRAVLRGKVEIGSADSAGSVSLDGDNDAHPAAVSGHAQTLD